MADPTTPTRQAMPFFKTQRPDFGFKTTTPQLPQTTIQSPQPTGPGLNGKPIGATPDPFAGLLAGLLAPRTAPAGPDLLGLIHALHPPDVQGLANRGYVPGVDNGSNPFTNGFFTAHPGTPQFSGRTTPKDPNAVAATMNQVAGMPGMLPVEGTPTPPAVPGTLPFTDLITKPLPPKNLSDPDYMRAVMAQHAAVMKSIGG